MSRLQEREVKQELNLLKTKVGLNIATTLKRTVKEYLEEQGEEDILNPSPQKAKEMTEKILAKFIEQTNKIIFNQEILKKLREDQEITLGDIEWQLNQLTIFQLWLSQQVEGYLILKGCYYRQQKQTYQDRSEEYKNLEIYSSKQLHFIRKEQEEIAKEVGIKKVENKEIAMKIINQLQQQNKIRKKQLAKSCEEWANDKEEQAEIKAWKAVDSDGWDD